MSKDKLNKEIPYKQRFKGVENFLRRVAFNLGNTASQTEVKIISCIPIDVTDLQQKVINLEKQLHEAKQRATTAPGHAGLAPISDKEPSTSKPTAVVNTALYGTSFAKQPSTVSYYSDKPLDNKSYQATSDCGNCTSKQRKSNVSFDYPALSTPHVEEACGCRYHENFDPDNDKTIAAAERYINIFRKRKRKKVCKGKTKMKTHLVYFAQNTQHNPFNLNETPFKHVETLNNVAGSASSAYLNNVIRRQYDPKFVIEEFSDTSHSKPICRDTNNTRARLYESDVCSCCHGRFQNIDNYMTTTYEPMHGLTDHDTNKTYYDSNLYDVVPVKENTNKFIKDEDKTKRNVEIKCWPENFRSKYRYDPLVFNYQTEVPYKRTNKIPSQKIKRKTKPEESKVKQKRTKQDQRPRIETSKSCSIDCGDIYKKHNCPVTNVQKSEPVKTILLKNALIETDIVNTKLLFNNQSTQLELIPDENKTESTLNQIKSILQSVLAEVKTNTKVTTALDKTPKKDAIVQKEASQNNMQGDSTLLHSFTYNNSYDGDPYLPSCSRQAGGTQYCFAGIPYQPPIKCLRNFPVFIHPSSGRPMCACYYRNNSHTPTNNKQATATATNTYKELQRASSNETEKLIKEIYKSMALNMDFPTKDNSVSEYEDMKSTEVEFINEKIVKSVKSTGMETVNRRDIEIEAIISPNVSVNSQLVYTAPSTQSEGITYSQSRHFEKPNSNEAKLDRFQQHSPDVIDEDNEETNNETENDELNLNEYEPPQKTKKKGLLHRMFKSVKLFKKRKTVTRQQSESEEENLTDASDSDDYETIYSGRTAKISPRRIQHDEINVKSSGLNAIQEKSRRSPYLEQEYRRRWNEGLMFERHQERKLSSERPISKQSSSKAPRPIFWNNYEARCAMIGNNVPTELEYVNSNKEMKSNDSLDKIKNDPNATEKLGWLKKHQLGINCGEQWKKFIVEN